MTELRQAMIDAMLLRGFAERTQQCYLRSVEGLARYYRRSPSQLSPEEIQRYFLYLVKERHLAPASVRLALNALVFLYRGVLHQEVVRDIVIPKATQGKPELLTRAEVGSLLAACSNHKHQTLLMVCYGCGLRVSELMGLRVKDIDGQRQLLHIHGGKGGKDRLVECSPGLLSALRAYWLVFRPRDWLFPGRSPTQALGVDSARKSFHRAKQRAGITKAGGIHALRHAYATHQLAAGMALMKLQHQLGHRDVRTTMRYLHWVPRYQGGASAADLIADLVSRHEHRG